MIVLWKKLCAAMQQLNDSTHSEFSPRRIGSVIDGDCPGLGFHRRHSNPAARIARKAVMRLTTEIGPIADRQLSHTEIRITAATLITVGMSESDLVEDDTGYSTFFHSAASTNWRL